MIKDKKTKRKKVSLNYANYTDFYYKNKEQYQNFAKTQFKNGFDYMISGHYHLGEIYNLDQGKLAVLGDWFHRPSYAKYDGKDLSLLQWEENV